MTKQSPWKIIQDPRRITAADLPLIVFSDSTSGLIEFFIKFRTKGSYNHVMWCVNPGEFISQGNTYSRVKMERYMKPNSRLKFVSIAGATQAGIYAIRKSIEEKLAFPWYKKAYNWVGIVGQATGLKFLNFPGLEYCSQDVPQHLKIALARCPEGFPAPLDGIVKNIPDNTSPERLNIYLHDFHSTSFPVYGKWEGDN